MDALTPCSIRARKIYARRCFPYRKKVIKLFLHGILLAAFVCQISFLLSDYLEKRTFWTSEEIADPPARFPPFTICPWPSFNPFRLINLGLNSSVATVRELNFNYENLRGIDDELPGRRLVEEAAWRLEEIVEEAMVGDVHEVYNTTNASSLLWQRTFNPIGPCLTLTPPPLSSLSSKSVMVKLLKSDLERCRWKENGFTRFYGGPEDCSAVQKHCDTSCAWEQFIKGVFRTNFFFLGSSSTIYNIHHNNVDMQMYRVMNYQVSAEPCHIVRISDSEIPGRLCFHECMVKAAERNKKCKGLLKSTIKEPVRHLCITQSQQYSLFKEFLLEGLMYRRCQISCKPDKQEIRWIVPEALSHSLHSGAFIVNLSSTSYTALTEKEVYPLRQFMSDVGGSLGLFLGISLLSVWEGILIVAKSMRGTRSDTHLTSTYIHLISLSGKVAISLVACTHLSLVLLEYRYQALNTEVTLRENIADISVVSGQDITKNFTEGSHPVRDLVIAHLASRSLGCQVIPQNSECGCFVRCILQWSKTLPPPLISTNDLPLCTQGHVSLPKKKYILSHQISKHFLREDQVKLCNTKCWKSKNDVHKNESINFSIEKNYQISKSSLICAVGGIIGLYYGFSLLDILPSLDSVCITRPVTKSTYNIVKLAIQISTAFVGILLTMFQVQSILFDHPVTTSYSSRSLEGRDLPAFTVCVWPPFNMKRILEEAGFEGAFEQTLNATSADKGASILSLFQKLSETQNSTNLDHLWRFGVWNNQEVEIQLRNAYPMKRYLECSKNAGDIFDSCHTYIPEYTGEADEVVYFSVTVFVPKESKVIFSIHSPDDLPVMETDAVLQDETLISIDQFSHWSGLQGDSRGWGKCVSECLNGALRKKMGCILPWSVPRGHNAVCNVKQYIELLGDLWSLGSRPQHTYSALLGTRVTNACRHKCHQKSGVFYGFRLNGEKHVTPSFTTQLIPSNNSQSVIAELKIATETFESVTEHDGYPVSKLLCDIGGIAGMTVGFSLAYIIDVIWKALGRK